MQDLTGLKFGSWTVIKFSHRTKKYAYYWVCQCDCGKIKPVLSPNLIDGSSTKCKNCGSKNNGVIHRLRAHKLYDVWHLAKQRCYNKNNLGYKNYGGRGIIICDKWLKNPKEFIDWAIANGWQKGLQIDRINNNGNYEPNNCRFVTHTRNNQNKRTTILNTEKIQDIRYLIDLGIAIRIISKLFHYDESGISKIKLNKIWRNVSYAR